MDPPALPSGISITGAETGIRFQDDGHAPSTQWRFERDLNPYREIESDVDGYAVAGRNGCGRVVLWFPTASAPRSIAQ